jgi:predicted phosphodiesterase
MGTVTALLSDIHGNLEALEEVMRDLDRQKPDRVCVLGDTVGYGPNPRECLERAIDVADVFLIGNHEKEILEPSDDINDDTRETLDWTVGELAGSADWDRLVERLGTCGFGLGASKVIDSCHFVHGSAGDPLEEYIWPAHRCQYLIFNRQIDERLAEHLADFTTLHGFFGHTHAPAVLANYDDHAIFDPYKHGGFEWDRTCTFVGPTSLYVVVEDDAIIEGLAERKVAINPGSVGQPRFVGNPDASYALYDGDTVTFRRVPYSRDRTQKKVAELPFSAETRSWLLERLEQGK